MLVGAFVIALGLALVTILVWLSSARGDESYSTYVAYVSESVAGLNENAKVQYNGVDIGHVGSIELDPSDPQLVRVTLEIEEGTPIKADTTATLTSSGITGVARMELSGGTVEAGDLEALEGQDYPVIQTTPSLFVRLDESISGLVGELSGTAEALTNVANRVEVLLDDENRQSIGNILRNVEDFTGDLDRITDEVSAITREISSVTGNVADASEGLPELIAHVGRLLTAYEGSALMIDQAAADLSTSSLGLDESVASVATGVNRVLADLTPLTRGTSSRLVHLVDEIQLLAATLRRVMEDVEQNPEMMLFGRPDAVRGPGE
ncbi:MAG: phospholipid/cholesterol/gamma-HCH transport system substrate-binding protein [Bradymonadia bacterium]|jgi:phospholipid/cholesterol/gamma-HCH transport system substrate-binding protein